MKLGVCYPWSSPFTFTAFTDSALNLRHPEGCEVRFFRGLGWCPAKRHIDMCQKAVDWGADLICIIGTDQAYDDDLLVRLVSRFDAGYEVVSALVPARGFVGWQPMKPFQPMAWRFKPRNEYRQYLGLFESSDMLEVVGRNTPHEEMERINFIGSGVLMFHRDHLLSLKKPWFYEKVDPETMTRLACMDTVFVWRLQQEAHATVWVDTTIKVRHAHVFQIDDSFQRRFEDWAEPGMGDETICAYKRILGQADMKLSELPNAEDGAHSAV
jgi:hypothetical protein